MDIFISLAIGVGLSAACGFRVFVPLLIMSLASMAGYLNLSSGFEWIGSWPAAIAFGAATLLEIGAYYIPWLDNFLDTISVPAATVAGVIAMASAMADLGPLLTWSVAIIAGGGGAASVKSLGAVVRAGSTAVTGGLGNAVVSTVEWVSAVIMSVLAVLIPLVAAVIAFALFVYAAFKLTGWLRKKA